MTTNSYFKQLLIFLALIGLMACSDLKRIDFTSEEYREAHGAHLSSSGEEASSSNSGETDVDSSSSSEAETSSSSTEQSSSSSLSLCGGEEYNQESHFCQSPNVVKDLCGTATYTATEFCQNPNIVKPLCGIQTYFATEICSNGIVKVGSKCGNRTELFDSDLYECGTAEGESNWIYLKEAYKPQDAAGKKYNAVLIGTQIWMAENLNYETAADSWCYDNNEDNCEEYGRLYDWATAMGIAASYNTSSYTALAKHKGICPEGWHIPSNAEWTTLTSFVGSSSAGTKLKAKSGYNDFEGSSGNGTDDFGFSALPGGCRFKDGYFGNAGNGGHWRSATGSSATTAYNWFMYYDYSGVDMWSPNKQDGLSVRCVRD